MSDLTKVWVRSHKLEHAITGKGMKQLRRGLPTDASSSDEDYIEWGWVQCQLMSQDAKQLQLTVIEQEHAHHGVDTTLPASCLKEGHVLMANKYGDDEYRGDDTDDEDDDPDIYPQDLITLTHLHEPEVVYCLRQRYAFDNIYTATGPILLALNPFKNCRHLYSESVMNEYRSHGEKQQFDESSEPLPPHVYGIADRSFRIMMTALKENHRSSSSGSRRTPTTSGKGASSAGGSCDQSILVSGESGAGKTVTTKFIMQYLAKLSQSSSSSSSSSGPKSSDKNIEQQVLQSNPILESFGNARTIRNDNSSRFGKFIEIKFSHSGSLVGASIETYLLEKVRLISQSEGERNYHIFYELFCMEEEKLDQFEMGDFNAEDFHMTNQSGTFDRRDGVEDFETYEALISAMETMGMTREEQDDALAMPCAALHASNISFIANSADESALDTENPHLEPFLKLTGLTQKALEEALCYLKIKAGREYHTRTLPKSKAQKGMEALIKAFYGALFSFLVSRVNESITVKDTKSSSGSSRRTRSSSGGQATIGVLDIFGFESFKYNSFEQLCINYCNEALQQQFNLFVLKNEQAEYDREGIEWSYITFPDNQDVLDLIDKKGSGILNILDDQCRAPGTTDKTFCIDLYKKCTGHARFEADYRQVGAQKFGVKHYAGPVEYDTKDFVEKNRDELPKEATDLLSSSTKKIVTKLADIIRNPGGHTDSPSSGSSKSSSRSTSPPSRRGGSKSKVTVGSQFSKQLHELRNKIDMTSPHYVRCLKPNDLLVPDHFNPLIISDQLRYAGVLEAVRVSRVGYPHRYSHKAFVSRYRILALPELKKAKHASRRIKPESVVVKAVAPLVWKIKQEQDIAASGGESAATDKDDKKSSTPNLVEVGMQIGKTKVFLRRQAYDILEQIRSGKMAESSVLIQTVGRGYMCRRNYQEARRDIILIQCLVRAQAARVIVHERRRNYRATCIQTLWRKGAAHKRYTSILCVARWGQRMQRGRSGRKRFHEINQNCKSTKIQRQWRRLVAQREYQAKTKALMTLQCAMRCSRARKIFKELRLGARDLNAAVTERDALRKEAQTLRLQLKEAKQVALEAKASAKDAKELTDLKKQHELMAKELNELKKAMAEESAKLATEIQRGDTLEASCAEKEKEIEEQTKRADEYKEKYTQEHERVDGMNESLGSKDKEIEKLKTDLLQVDQLEAEVSKKTSDLKLLQNLHKGEVEDFKAMLEEKQTQLTSQSEQLEEFDEIKDKLKVKEEEIEKYQQDMSELEEKHSQETAEVDELRNLLSEKERELAETKEQLGEVDDIKTLLCSKNEEIMSYQEKLEELEETKALVASKDEEIESLRRELEEEQNKESDAATRNSDMEQELGHVKEQLVAALEEAEVAQKELEIMMTERNEADEVSKSIANVSTSTADPEDIEEVTNQLEEALKTIDDLEEKLDAARNGTSPSIMDDVDKIKQEFDEYKTDAKRELEDAEITIEELSTELETLRSSSGSPSKRHLAELAGDAAAEEILTLQDEVNRLNQELMELREKGVPVDIDPNSPEQLAKRYEELSRLAVAGLEKDKEIEALKKKLEELDGTTMPTELDNNEEADHLRHYIHELQKEIEALREELDEGEALRENSNTTDDESRSGSFVGSVLKNFLRKAKSSEQSITDHSDEVENIIRDLEAEVEALREVNEMLRIDVEKSRKRIKELEFELEDEKERAKNELEAFAKTLRGVDELRVAAESMSREVNKYKKQVPPPHRDSVTYFQDEVSETDLGQAIEEATKIIDTAVDQFEVDKKEKEGPKLPFFGLMHGQKNQKSRGTINTASGEDVEKVVERKKSKKKKKKRRGSGNSVVSSFF